MASICQVTTRRLWGVLVLDALKILQACVMSGCYGFSETVRYRFAADSLEDDYGLGIGFPVASFYGGSP